MKNFKKIIPLRFHKVSYSDISKKIQEIITEQIKERNGVYFYGESGVGKTHIVCALVKNLLENNIEVMFLNTGEFLERIRQEYNENEDRDCFRDVMDFKGVLIFDDIGAEKTSEWVRERLYLIINKKYEDMIPVIFTSNHDLETLASKTGDRIVSRIVGMTKIIKVEGDDKRLN